MDLLFSFILQLLLFTNIINATDIQNSVVGCDFNAIQSEPGFKGVFYEFSDSRTDEISDVKFYGGGYLTGSIAGTASKITDINFSVPGGEENIYGVVVNSSNLAIEYTGYFKGKY